MMMTSLLLSPLSCLCRRLEKENVFKGWWNGSDLISDSWFECCFVNALCLDFIGHLLIEWRK